MNIDDAWRREACRRASALRSVEGDERAELVRARAVVAVARHAPLAIRSAVDLIDSNHLDDLDESEGVREVADDIDAAIAAYDAGKR